MTLATLDMASVSVAGEVSAVSFEAATPELRGETIVVPLTIRNGTGEPIKQVTPGIRFIRWMSWAAVHPELAAGAELDVNVVSATGDLGIGRWPYCLFVDYATASGRRVQMLDQATFVLGDPPPATVTLTVDAPAPLAESGVLRVHLDNTGAERRTVNVTACMPRGFKVPEGVAPVELPAGDEALVELQLRSQARHPGSYEIFVAAEYEEGPVHQAVIAPVTLDTRQ